MVSSTMWSEKRLNPQVKYENLKCFNITAMVYLGLTYLPCVCVCVCLAIMCPQMSFLSQKNRLAVKSWRKYVVFRLTIRIVWPYW